MIGKENRVRNLKSWAALKGEDDLGMLIFAVTYDL